MKNEEAIDLLSMIEFEHSECCLNTWYKGIDDDMKEALEMAIKALKQEPILDKIRAEIKEWYWQADKQALAKDPCVVDAMVDLFIRTIDKYKGESEE